MYQKILRRSMMNMTFGMAIASIIILNLLHPANLVAAYDFGWKVQHLIGKFQYSNPPRPDQIFNFQYRVVNGTLENLTTDQGSFTAKVKSVGKGVFDLRIPRNYPYTNSQQNYPYSNSYVASDPAALVMVNGFEIDSKYSFVATDCFFEYAIPFSQYANIEIGFGYLTVATPHHGDKVPYHCIKDTIYNATMTYLLTPLKQVKSGILPEDVACSDDKALVKKNTEDSPACVTPESASRLVLWGWAKNPLSAVLSSDLTNDQKNRFFYYMMNLPKLKEWSSTGWTFVQTVSISEDPGRNIHAAEVELYLPPDLGSPKVKCEYGWYALLTLNTKTLEVEGGTYPRPDSCIK